MRRFAFACAVLLAGGLDSTSGRTEQPLASSPPASAATPGAADSPNPPLDPNAAATDGCDSCSLRHKAQVRAPRPTTSPPVNP